MRLFRAAAVSIILALGGCSTVASVATSLSSPTPTQVQSLADADLAADAVVQLTKVAVDTGKLDSGTLTELQALRAGVRTALDALHTANTAGQNINYASFNAALTAYQAYATVKGIN